MTLYEIASQFEELAEIAEENPEMNFSDTLESLQMDFSEKMENCAKYIKNLEADLDGYDSEIERLKEKKEATKKRVSDFKNYIVACMNIAGVKKEKFGVFTLSVRHSSTGSLVLDVPEEKLPTTYLVEKVTYSVDKKKLKEDLEHGKVDAGLAHIVPTPDSVSIK